MAGCRGSIPHSRRSRSREEEQVQLSEVVDTMEHSNDLGKRLLDDQRYAHVVKTWMLCYVHRRASERHERPELDLHGDV